MPPGMQNRSKAILFKKLQKEVEDAIRKTDAFGRGFLEREQLIECLNHLGYLMNINSQLQLMQTQRQVE